MTAPTAKTRVVMLERDGRRCVACGTTLSLEAQHRAAVGMGGSLRRPELDELLTACTVCNGGFEAAGQTRALRFGWKVRKWVGEQGIAYRVPVYFMVERTWFLLERDGRRVPISFARARSLMDEVYGPEYYDWEATA